MTRKQAKAVGLGCQTNIEMATGFKLQDAVLLNDCISRAVARTLIECLHVMSWPPCWCT